MHNSTLPLAIFCLAPSIALAQGTLYQVNDFGGSAAGLGDIDLDGRPDVIVARVGTPVATPPSVGEARILSTLDGSILRVHAGAAPGNGFGVAVAGLGDLDLDGTRDYAITTATSLAGSGVQGRVEVFSGATGSLLYALTSPSPGFHFGLRLASGGDFDGDLVPDLAVGALGEMAGTGGLLFVHSGSTGALIRSHASPAGSQSFGGAFATLEDVDGDGRDDYALGDPEAGAGAGEATVVSGATGTTIRLLTAPAGSSSFGSPLAGTGDADGDGVADLLVGAPGESVTSWMRTGVVRLHSGANGALVRTFVAPLGAIGFGSSLAALSDIDGDQVRDFAMGYRQTYTGTTVMNNGRVMFYSGASGALLDAWTANGGGDAQVAGDINLDGRDDLVVGIFLPWGQLASTVRVSASPDPVHYCTAKAGSLGCQPAIYALGTPSATIGAAFDVHGSGLRSQSPALLVWGVAPAGTPFGGGTLCVAAPRVRAPIQNSAGSAAPDCSGTYAFTFDRAYLASVGLAPGVTAYAQIWARDAGFPPPNASLMTRGLAFTVWP